MREGDDVKVGARRALELKAVREASNERTDALLLDEAQPPSRQCRVEGLQRGQWYRWRRSHSLVSAGDVLMETFRNRNRCVARRHIAICTAHIIRAA